MVNSSGVLVRSGVSGPHAQIIATMRSPVNETAEIAEKKS